MGTPHDALFRRTFGRPEHAAPLLRALLPARTVSAISWGSLTPVSGSRIDARLRSRHSDQLFSVTLAGRPAYLYVLFEHKARPDRYTALQVLGYMVDIWQDPLRRRPRPQRLPPILPVVVHCGRHRWRTTTDLRSLLDLAGLPPDLRAEIERLQPQFGFEPHDFARRTEAEVRAMALSLHGLWSLACLQFLGPRGDDDDAVIAAIADWADVARRAIVAATGQDALDAVTSYILQTTKLDRRRLRVVLGRHLGPTAMKKFVSTYEQIRREGVAEGKAEGKAEGRAEQLLRQLHKRFGAAVKSYDARIRGASIRELDRWAERILDARSAAEVFADS